MMSERGDEITAHTRRLRDRLQNKLFGVIEGLTLNGCPALRHPGNLNVAVPSVSGERLLGALPEIAFSSGSACTSASASPSHVISALSADERRLAGSVRFGVCKANTEEEIDYVADRVIDTVARLRVSGL
jgi:cysteine desulfurase